MKEHSGRIENTIHNMYIGLFGQIITYILTFVYRTIFIKTLGADYLGIQGLFSNILSILSLAELGIGSAITFSLYKPLANNNNEIISQLMNLYSKMYRIIGLIVAVIGLSIIPFMDNFINGKQDIPYITLIYLLYLADSVSSYFFSYKRSILVADQKGYINTLNINIFAFVRTVIQCVLLVIYKNFILVLVIQIVFTFLSNLSISNKVNIVYPYLKNKNSNKMDPGIKLEIFKKIRAMSYHQFGSVAVLGTDNLLISFFVGIYWVGIYSNYLLIIGVIKTILQQFSQSVLASVGNLVSSESLDKTKTTFDFLLFINYWIYYFCSICFFTLINPFITIWIGSEYLFDVGIVVIITINFYVAGMRQNVLTFRNALGLFLYDRYKPFFEVVINLVVSIFLVKTLGIIGVFIGTFVSTVTTSLWVEPYVLFKYHFKIGLKQYCLKYLLYTTFTVLVAFVMRFFSKIVFDGSKYSFIVLLLACIIIPNVLFCVVFSNTKEFKKAFFMAKNLFYGLK
jgi:Membrane protein involved in the export of O-antigen and teichoic acid